ncbi:MAG: histidine--tRNA ligase [Gemmatimonadetes bacterium]|nr:histidine--tRNA ligase [Gemmatimonadota bacterium]
MLHKALPGFRDFYPPEFAVRSHITGVWREIAHRFGFEEYDGPPLEALELYVEKSGEEIVGQLYNFVDKGERAVALRPEMTPTLARRVAARAAGLRKPIRWFSVPQLFRYERTQRGRLREHFQWNVDILGEEAVAADAEVLAVALAALQALGLTGDDVVARYNDRRLLERLGLGAGGGADRLLATYLAIDKLTREPREVIRDRLVSVAGIGATVADAVLAIFQYRDLAELRLAFGKSESVLRELDRLEAYGAQLARLGFGAYTAFDPTIVRGLAYYTGTVFEIFDRRGELRAICGGGRYDNLLRNIGAVSLPAVGFGMGDVVLGELLAERGLLPAHRPRADYYLIAVTEAERPVLLQVAGALRARGAAVLYGLKHANVGKQFKDADARGAREVLVFGPEELAAGQVVHRVMGTGEERRTPLSEWLGGGA